MTRTLTLSAGTGDCYADSTGTFDSTATEIYLVSGAGVEQRTWIPFTVNLSRNEVVISATLKLIASFTSGAIADNVVFGCEAADNPANPTTKADLFARSMSAATYTNSIGQYVSGTTYNYDVTNAVQEIIQRAGWVSGNTLAAFTKWTGFGPHPKRYTSNEGGANKPVLEIVVYGFLPRSGGMI